MQEKNPLIISASIIAAGFIIVGIIMNSAWRNHTSSNETITVTGSAKRDIISDFAILRGTINSTSSGAADAFRKLEAQKPALYDYLAKQGFPKDKVVLNAVVSNSVYELTPSGAMTNNVVGYNYSQRFEIQSEDCQKIKNISLDISSIVEKGVNFTVDQPEYYFTKIAKLKIEIQAEAAKDAYIRATKIAEASNSKIGVLRNARMGVLQITPKNSNAISDSGINDVSSVEKEITAVVNASFEIK